MRKISWLVILLIVVIGGYLIFQIVDYKLVDYKLMQHCNNSLRTVCNLYYRTVIITNSSVPIVENWCDSIDNQCTIKIYLKCPGQSSNSNLRSDYAINENVANYTFEDFPDDLVLFFESGLGWNGVGGKDDICYTNHDNDMVGIILVDGYAFHIEKGRIGELRWE